MLLYLLGSSFGLWETIAFVLAYLLALVIAFSAHEFAHAFSAYKFGDITPKLKGRLTLNPFAHIDLVGIFCLMIFGFGWAKPVEINPLKFKRFKLAMTTVSLAGVVTNLVIAFLSSGLLFFGLEFGWFEGSTLIFSFLYYFLWMLVTVNLTLFVFNLLPIFPLDGFNLLQTFLGYRNKFMQFLIRYGTIILLILIITPLFGIIHGAVTGFFMDIFDKFWGLFI